jgi:hypothetical protein
MRTGSLAVLLAAVFLASANGDVRAEKKDPIVGLPLEELLACAGVPQSQMASGDYLFLQYGDFEDRNIILNLGGIPSVSRKQRGCQATVTVNEGLVVRVTYKSKGLISGPMACNRIFSECGR